jgi:hypothetical protein
MQIPEKIHYYSLVGKRAIPVCLPLFTILHRNAKRAEVNLIYTGGTYNEAEECKNFIEEVFRDRVSIQIVAYKDIIDKLDKISLPTNSFWNLSPGMNWQVSEVTLKMDNNSTILLADTEYLYFYKSEDFSLTNKLILKNLGLENYIRLNKEVSIEQTDTPHKIARENLELSRGYIFKEIKILNKERVGSNILKWINKSLIAVKEHKGFLYLYIDMNDIPQDILKRFQERKNRACTFFYRIVNSVFPSENYRVIIYTNDQWLIERAKIDNIYAVDTIGKLKSLFNSPPLPYKYKIEQSNDREGSRLSKDRKGKILFLCCGINVEPTIKAIHYHKPDTVILFYDKNTPYTQSIAKNIRTLYFHESLPVILKETDHLGSDIVKTISEYTRGFKEVEFNITPGTKAQTIALSIGAKYRNSGSGVWSIKDTSLKNIITGEERAGIDKLEDFADRIIKINFSQWGNISKYQISEENIPLWQDILKGLASGRIRYRGEGLRGLGLRLDEKNHTVEYNGKRYKLPEEYFETPDDRDTHKGKWWEAVVATALMKICKKEDIGLNLEWPIKQKPLTELDIVFSYKSYIVVISCKTALSDIDYEVFLLLSEAKKRFGRFTICCIAVPEKSNSYESGNRVRIIGVDELSRIDEVLDEFIASLKTT